MIRCTAGVPVRVGLLTVAVNGFACADATPVPGRATGDYALACQSAPETFGLPTALERVAWFENVSGQWLSWEVGEWLQSNLAARVWAELTDEERSTALVGDGVTEEMLADVDPAVWQDSLTVAEVDAAFEWARDALSEFTSVVTASWESCIWLNPEGPLDIVRSGTFEGLRVYQVRIRSDSTLYWTANAVEIGTAN
ncbi:MAG: hypothetical protein OXQ94_14060 [Gemmatimonadota bacterium]|nr:hypothetical protein [Gemmatimonadota bacterium]MDE2872801.1 hypothetical protein [Gemmatimonadota bacterium]